MMRRCFRWVFIAFLLVPCPVSLFAQTHFATFTGTVTSTDGSSVPDAEVVATNTATQVTYTGRSNMDGLYTISALPIGTYTIRAQAQGFRPFETNPIRLESGQTARVDITMQVGGFEQTVEVTGVTPILQTQNAVVGEVISETTIRNTPLNGRNFSQLTLLLPGVVTTGPDSFTEPKNFGGGRPYVNGQREQENNYTLDGVDMNEAIDNLLPYQPSPDALAEVRVETNNYSAEFGNVAGAVVGSTIKSGTNEFHGNVFEYWRDSSMAANTWDNNRRGAKKADLSQHIFGATFGGPIVQNKIFFFSDYQAFLRDRPGEQVRTVAPEAWRRGDFSGVAGITVRDPVTGQPFPGNVIPESRFSPIARAVLGNQTLYPLPNRPGDTNNLVVGSSDKQRAHQGDIKVDANLTNDDRMFGRFSYQHYTSEPERAALESQLTSTNDAPFLGVAVNWNRTLGATAVNELLVGYTKVKFETTPTDWAGIGNANATIGIPGDQAIAGLSQFAIGNVGFGDAGIAQFNDVKSYQLTEKFSWFKGRHSMKFGGRWLYQRQGFSYSGNEGILGHFDYSGRFTGFGFADFLLDNVALKGRGGLVSPFTQLGHRVGIFAQDDYRIRDDLTVNLGLTWEYTSPWVEKDDRQSNIDLETGQLLLAGENGNSRALYDAYYGGWEPRVGAAWTPSDKWVVRGAFGIVQYMEGTGKNLRLPANPPFNFEGQRSFDATTGPGTASNGFDDVSPNVTGQGSLFRIFPPDLRPQLTKQWNVFVERKLTDTISAQVGYVGSRSSHMVVPFDFNQPEPDPGPVETWRPLDQRRPLYPLNPAIGATSGTNSIGIGAYDAMQASVRQRPTEGLEFLASYTYGKALSDNVGYYGVNGGTAVQGYYYLDSTNPRKDYGPSPYDVRHLFSLAANYELPFGRNRRFGTDWGTATNAVLGNWNLNSIFQARTGLAISVRDGAGQSLQAPRGFERPNRVCNGGISGAGVDDVWLDISCFQHAPRGQFGDSGAGILHGPGYWNWDLGLTKDLYLDDRRYLTFRIEAFNVLNHANFKLDDDSTNMADPTTFGRILRTFSAPRIVELVGKFTF